MFWRGVLGYLPVNIVQGVVGLLTIVVFTRVLEPVQYGDYALALSVVMVTHTALFTWLEAAMARFQPAEAARGFLSDHFATLYRTWAILAVALLVIGSIALLVALPVMAIIAIAVRLDSPGPILFRQKRHGFNNEEIVVWKFRSMRADAADATASRQVSGDDDRVTRVGRFIRATSLDELPQIFNVLKGEMSLVGPRRR